MLRSAQICKKCTILGNLSIITQEGKEENWQVTRIFLSIFWVLTVYDIYFYIWKLSKVIFMGSPFYSILFCKILEFRRWKLWDQNFVPSIQKTNIKESEKTCFTFFIELRTKFVWSRGLFVRNQVIMVRKIQVCSVK